MSRIDSQLLVVEGMCSVKMDRSALKLFKQIKMSMKPRLSVRAERAQAATLFH